MTGTGRCSLPWSRVSVNSSICCHASSGSSLFSLLTSVSHLTTSGDSDASFRIHARAHAVEVDASALRTRRDTHSPPDSSAPAVRRLLSPECLVVSYSSANKSVPEPNTKLPTIDADPQVWALGPFQRC